MRRPHEELKQFSLSAFNTAYFSSTAGQIVVDVSAATQGNGGAQRTGDHLYAYSLQLRYLIFNGIGTTANGFTTTRIFMIQYLGDSSVAGHPTIGDFLVLSNANSGNTYGSYSSFDNDYARQYRILWDSGLIPTYGTNAAAVTADCRENHAVGTVNIPLSGNRDIQFYTGGTTGFNHIFLVVTSDAPTIATNPAFSYNTTFRFTDS